MPRTGLLFTHITPQRPPQSTVAPRVVNSDANISHPAPQPYILYDLGLAAILEYVDDTGLPILGSRDMDGTGYLPLPNAEGLVFKRPCRR